MTHVNRAARAAYWQEVLDQHRNSGMSVKAFCEERGIAQPSFYQWRQKLQARGEDAAQPMMVPVNLIAQRPTSPASLSVQIFTPQGFSIRIDAATPREALVDILRAIDTAATGARVC